MFLPFYRETPDHFPALNQPALNIILRKNTSATEHLPPRGSAKSLFRPSAAVAGIRKNAREREKKLPAHISSHIRQHSHVMRSRINSQGRRREIRALASRVFGDACPCSISFHLLSSRAKTRALFSRNSDKRERDSARWRILVKIDNIG